MNNFLKVPVDALLKFLAYSPNSKREANASLLYFQLLCDHLDSSKNYIGYEPHNDSRYADTQNHCRAMAFLKLYAKEGCDQGSCPGSCPGQWDSNKQHQSPELVFLYLIALLMAFASSLSTIGLKVFVPLHPFKDRSDQEQDKRHWNNVADNT